MLPSTNMQMHYRKPDICRVLKALPRAIYRALGKVTICRVPTERHSVTKRHSAKIYFAECLFTDTRQTCLCRVPRGQHSAHSLTCAPHTPAAPVTHHGRYYLPSARKGTLGKHLFAECHEAGTRQRLSRAPHATVTPLPRTLHRCEDCYRYRLPSDRLGALGIQTLCRVSSLALGEITKKFLQHIPKFFLSYYTIQNTAY